jgi:hypothetical protein
MNKNETVFIAPPCGHNQLGEDQSLNGPLWRRYERRKRLETFWREIALLVVFCAIGSIVGLSIYLCRYANGCDTRGKPGFKDDGTTLYWLPAANITRKYTNK